MRNLQKLMLFIAFFFSSSVFAVPPAGASAKPLSETEIIAHYSYTDLLQILNGITLAIGGEAWCALEMTEAQKLMMPLRPLYEKKMKLEKKAVRNAPVSSLVKTVHACRANCLCSGEEDLYAGKPGFPKTERQWLKKNHSFSTAQLKQCGERAKHFCLDPILPSLKAIWAKEYQAD